MTASTVAEALATYLLARGDRIATDKGELVVSAIQGAGPGTVRVTIDSAVYVVTMYASRVPP